MKYARWTAFAVLALALVGCASKGAGQSQDPCGLAQVQQAAPAELVQQQQQAMDGGQDVSSQPNMTDPAKWSPGTTWGGGAGAVSAENMWDEKRNLATGSTVAQGLLFPQTQGQKQGQKQEAEAACVGVPHPQILSLDRQLEAAQKRLSAARAMGDQEAASAEYDLIADLNQKYETASASTAKTVTIHYDFNGAYITQGVSSGATADGKPGAATTSDEGTGVTPAEIAKKAGAVPMASDSLPEPPAGVAEPE